MTPPANSVRLAAARQDQAGVAAIELGLTLVLLLMIFFAIVGYGALFWARQSMDTVAADTARHALLESYTTPQTDAAVIADVKRYACQSAQQIGVLKAFSDLASQGSCGGFVDAQSGEASECTSAAAASATHRCLTITLNLTVNQWPLMNTMHQFAKALTSNPEAWVPKNLRTAATLLIAAPPQPPETLTP